MSDNLIRIVSSVEDPLPGNSLFQMQRVDQYNGDMSEEEIYRRKIGVIEAGIEDNCKQHGIRGILDHANIMAMIAEYNDEDKQARVYGKFQHLTGLVFKKFTRKIHIKKPFFPRPQDYMVIELLDPHPRVPDALMWVGINAKGQKFVVDELYEKFSSIDDMAYKIKQKGNQYRVVQRRADPAAWSPDGSDRAGVTLADRLRDRGLTYIPASKQRTLGIGLVNDALDYQANFMTDGTIEYTKEPMLYVFETCERTIWEFEHWQYNEYTGKAAEKHNQSEKPQDKDDHMMENLGRVFLDEMPFIPMERRRYNEMVGEIPATDPF